MSKEKALSMGAALLLLLVGLCLIIWPGQSANVICYVLGALALIFGIYRGYCYFKGSDSEATGLHKYDFSLGVFSIILGLIFIVAPNAVASLLPVVMGIVILADGIFKLQKSLDLRRAGFDKWWTVLIFAAVCCVFGILLIANPFAAVKTVVVLMGITLVVDAIQNLWTLFATPSEG